MRFRSRKGDLFIPDNSDETAALGRTTHMAVGAHQDDLEIMAYHGISACFASSEKWFTGVVATDGAGSARTGIYASYSDDAMQRVRRREQRKAAVLGEYASLVQLGWSSAAVKGGGASEVVADLEELFALARPDVVYLHNPADKHDTHVALLIRAIDALRRLDEPFRPRQVYGCEVWRDLDWLVDEEKCALPVDERPSLAAALVAIFDSQISGGKRYDLATAGRRLAHASYHDSHETDSHAALTYAIDLNPLVGDSALSIVDFTLGRVDRFRGDVARRLAALA